MTAAIITPRCGIAKGRGAGQAVSLSRKAVVSDNMILKEARTSPGVGRACLTAVLGASILAHWTNSSRVGWKE
jgi:hypothetical protein